MPKKYHPIGAGMTPSRTKLGEFLRTRRIELGLSQVQVAKLSGTVSQKFYSMLEIGIKRYPNTKKLEGLAKALESDCLELQTLASKPSEKRQAESEPQTELGKLIRMRREQLGLTQKDLAKKLKWGTFRVRSLERGKNSKIRYCLQKSLVKALNLKPSDLSKFAGTSAKPTNNPLGRLVRARRQELGFSQEQLAEKLIISRQFVSQIELGQCRLSGNDEIIKKLGQALKLKAAELRALKPQRKLKEIKKEGTEPATLGGFLGSRRVELGLTQKEVAVRVGISASVISVVERGRRPPRSEILDRLKKVLKCDTPSELL